VAFQTPKTAPANKLNKTAPGMHQICKKRKLIPWNK